MVNLAGTGAIEIRRVDPDGGDAKRCVRAYFAELEGDALASGATTARLETNKALVEAIALYRSAGYKEVPAFNDEPFAHHWFEKQLPADG